MSAIEKPNIETSSEEVKGTSTEVNPNYEEKENGEFQTPPQKSTLQSKTDSSDSSTKKRKRSRVPPGRPLCSYVALITMAIRSSLWRKTTLAGIRNFIADRYPYYRTRRFKWKNSIRNNLLRNDCFIKLPHDSQDQTRAHYSTFHPASEMMFENGSYRRRKKIFTRQQQLNEILPSLAERTKIPTFDTPHQLVQPIPDQHRIPTTTHAPTTNHRRGFTIDKLLAPRPVPTLVSNSTSNTASISLCRTKITEQRDAF